jgi:acyl-coenzyme A synthetase/AMP-(fatty) acid ligase
LRKTTSGKIIRAELRRQEGKKQGERQENEFWESNFPELHQ